MQYIQLPSCRSRAKWFSWPGTSLNFSSWKTGPKDKAPYWKVFEKHVELTYASWKQSFYPIFIMSKKQTPSDFLKQIIGRPVVVKLNNGVDYRGVLACLDGYMNIALEQTEEYSNGQLKNKYGDAFLRGNNGKSCCGPVTIVNFVVMCFFWFL